MTTWTDENPEPADAAPADVVNTPTAAGIPVPDAVPADAPAALSADVPADPASPPLTVEQTPTEDNPGGPTPFTGVPAGASTVAVEETAPHRDILSTGVESASHPSAVEPRSSDGTASNTGDTPLRDVTDVIQPDIPDDLSTVTQEERYRILNRTFLEGSYRGQYGLNGAQAEQLYIANPSDPDAYVRDTFGEQHVTTVTETVTESSGWKPNPAVVNPPASTTNSVEV